MPDALPEPRDFFISYTGPDQPWAEWIAATLEDAGYTVFLQAWHFRPGENIVERMAEGARAKQTLAVCSNAYFEKAFTHPEWQAAFFGDPRGAQRKLIPIRIEKCDLPELLRQRIYIDLVGASSPEVAGRRLLDGLRESGKPDQPPPFPRPLPTAETPPVPGGSPSAAPQIHVAGNANIQTGAGSTQYINSTVTIPPSKTDGSK